MKDPLHFILDALLRAASAQPLSTGNKMMALLELMWDRLSGYQKISLLGVPGIVSILSDQPQNASDLIAQFEKWMNNSRQSCEALGYSFEWDPEGWTWSLPYSKLPRALSEDEHWAVENGITYIYGMVSDLCSVFISAEQHRHREFGHTVTLCESTQTLESASIDSIFQSMAKSIKHQSE